MTTEPHASQDRANEPNEFGFAGDATAPQPEPRRNRDDEDIAVPAGDLTGAITESIDEATDRRHG